MRFWSLTANFAACFWTGLAIWMIQALKVLFERNRLAAPKSGLALLDGCHLSLGRLYVGSTAVIVIVRGETVTSNRSPVLIPACRRARAERGSTSSRVSPTVMVSGLEDISEWSLSLFSNSLASAG